MKVEVWSSLLRWCNVRDLLLHRSHHIGLLSFLLLSNSLTRIVPVISIKVVYNKMDDGQIDNAGILLYRAVIILKLLGGTSLSQENEHSIEFF